VRLKHQSKDRKEARVKNKQENRPLKLIKQAQSTTAEENNRPEQKRERDCRSSSAASKSPQPLIHHDPHGRLTFVVIAHIERMQRCRTTVLA
jgi:hypothetical protein